MKILVYDGDCSMCRGLSRLLVRRCLTGDTIRRPFDDFEGDTARRLLDSQIHNELAAIDRATGEIRSGFAAILWILGAGALRPLTRLLALPGIRHGLTFLYRLVAYNRRILAPVKPRSVPCACDPDPSAVHQWAFIGVCLVLASLWWLPSSGFEAAPALATVAGLGAATAVVALARGGRRTPPRTVVFGHLSWIMLLSAVPLYLLTAVQPLPWLGTLACGGAAALAIAAALIVRRRSQLGFGAVRAAVAPVVLWGSAFGSLFAALWLATRSR